MSDHSYRVRAEQLADDALLVVRGGLLEFASLRADALAAAARFGAPGISVFAAPTASDLDDLARERLDRFEVVTVMTAGAIRSAGLELLPTFRRPRYTVLLPGPDAGLRALLGCENRVIANPHHTAPG